MEPEPCERCGELTESRLNTDDGPVPLCEECFHATLEEAARRWAERN